MSRKPFFFFCVLLYLGAWRCFRIEIKHLKSLVQGDHVMLNLRFQIDIYIEFYCCVLCWWMFYYVCRRFNILVRVWLKLVMRKCAYVYLN